MTDEERPTHAAVPLPVFAAVLKTLNQLPYDQVQAIMAELNKCHQITIAEPKPDDQP